MEKKQSDKIGVRGTELTLKPTLEVEIEQKYNSVSLVSVITLMDATMKVTGTVTGNKYIFHGAGSFGTNEETGEEGIDERDVDELLNKKRKNSCCGGSDETRLFELV